MLCPSLSHHFTDPFRLQVSNQSYDFFLKFGGFNRGFSFHLDPGLRVFLFLLFALHVVHFRHGQAEQMAWLMLSGSMIWSIHIYIYYIHIISICFQHILYIFYNYRSMFSWAKKRPWDLRVWRSVLDHWKSFAMEPFGWQWHPLHPVEVLVAGQKYQTSWLQVARDVLH